MQVSIFVILSYFKCVVNYDTDSGWTNIFSKLSSISEISDDVSKFYKEVEKAKISLSDTKELVGFAKGLKMNNEEFIEFLNNSEYSEKTLENYQKSMKSASSATSKFGATLKSVAANIGIMLVVSLAIKAATAVWDYYNVTVEETREKIDEINSSLKELRTEFDELNSRSPETLSKSEQARLDYLDTRIAKEKELLEVQQARLNQELVGHGFTDYFDEENYSAKIAKEQDRNFGLEDLLLGNFASIFKGLSDTWSILKGGTSDNIDILNFNTKQTIDGYKSVSEQIEILKKTQEGLNKSSREYYELQQQIEGLQSGQEFRSNNMQEQRLVWKDKISNYEAEIETLNSIINDPFSSSDTRDNARDKKAQYEEWLSWARIYVDELETILVSPVEAVKSIDERLANVTKEELQDAFTDDELSLLVTQDFDEEASIVELRDLLKALKQEVNDNPITVELLGISETIPLLDSLGEKMKVLDTSYAKLFNPDEDLGFADLQSIYEAFGDVASIDTYIERIRQAGQDTAEVNSVMEELIREYLELSGVLDNVNETNAGLIENTLTELGIQNSHDLVVQALAKNTEELAMQEAFLAECEKDASKSAIDVINSLNSQNGYTEEARIYLLNYALTKETANGIHLDTTEDIVELANLVGALNGATYALNTLKYIKEQGAYLPTSVIEDMEAQAVKDVQDAINNSKNKVEWQPEIEWVGGDTTASAIDKETESALKEVEQTTKDYVESYLNFMEKSLESNRIDFKTYSNDVSKFLKDMFEQGEISAEEYFNYTQDMLSYKRDVYKSVISAVVDTLDDEIDVLEKEKELIEKNYQTKIDAIQSEIDLREELYEQRKKEKALDDAIYEAERARNQRTSKQYVDGQMIYTLDGDAIRDAEDNLADKKHDIEISRLQSQISTLKTEMEKETAVIDKQIDYLELYKDQWNSVADEYSNAQAEIYTSGLLGMDWQSEVTSGNLEILNDFKTEYLAIEQAIADASLQAAKIAWDSANEQIRAAREAAKGASGTEGSANIDATIKTTAASYEVVDEYGKTMIRFKGDNAASRAEEYRDSLDDAIHDLDKIKIQTYHNGLEGGYVGDKTPLSKDKRLEVLQKAGRGDGELKSDEQFALLKKKELVLTEMQQVNIADTLLKNAMIPRVNIPDYSQLNNMIVRNSQSTPIVQNVTLSCPNLTNNSGIEYVQKALGNLSQRAYQESHKRK